MDIPSLSLTPDLEALRRRVEELEGENAVLARRAARAAEAESAHRLSETRFRALFEQFPLSVQIFAPDGKTLAVNHAWHDLFGLTLADIQAFNPLHDPQLAPIREHLLRGFAGEVVTIPPHPFDPTPYNGDAAYHGEAAHKPAKWLEVTVWPVRDDGGDICEVIVVHRDVTERIEAEAALQRAHDELEGRVEKRTAELAQAERRFRAIAEASPVPLLLSRVHDGTVVFANDRLETLVQVSPGSLVGRRTPDFYFDPADRPSILATIQEEGVVRDLELRIRRADGTPRWVSLCVQPLVFDGEPTLLTALVDITERREIEEALRRRTQELEAIFRALPDLYFRMKADGTILAYRVGRSFGLYAPPETFLGRRVQEVLPDPVGPQVGEALAEVARTGDLVCIEYLLPLGEERRDFEARLLPLEDEQVIAVVRDITTQKQAEAAIRASEESYRGLFDTLTELVYVQDLEGRFLAVNEAVVRAYGYARDEIVGRTPEFLGVPGTMDPEAFAEVFAKTVAGDPQRFEWWGRRKDGSVFPKEVVIKRSCYFGQDVIIAVARDITAQKEAEQALRRSEEHFRRLTENGLDLIQLIDTSGSTTYISPSVERLVGYTPEEMVGRSAEAGLHRDDMEHTMAALTEAVTHPGTTQTATYRVRHRDGSWRVFEGYGRTFAPDSAAEGVVINARDITERTRADEALRVQKALLEAQGEASIDGILVVAPTGEMVSFNRRFVEMWEIPPEVSTSQSDEAALQAVVEKLVDPDGFLARVAYLYEHPDEASRDEILLRDGRVFDRYSAPVRSQQGDYYGRIWFFRDITERKRAEEALRAGEERERQHAQRLERELEVGRQIQLSFLPAELLHPPGWDIATRFQPASQVAGDFYDTFGMPAGRVGLIVADVCGKGVGAALFMALFRSLLRAHAERASASRTGTPQAAEAVLREAVTATNGYIVRVHKPSHLRKLGHTFASVFFGVLDPETGTLHYVNAGHEPPVVIGLDGSRFRLRPTGPALGLTADAVFKVETLALAPGETLLAYTDGVTEARNADGDFFSEERLLDLVEDPLPSATALLDRIAHAVRLFAAGGAPSDDVTLMALRRGSAE